MSEVVKTFKGMQTGDVMHEEPIELHEGDDLYWMELEDQKDPYDWVPSAAALSTDAEGHSHKGKGPGGGQFTKGSGGDSGKKKESHSQDEVDDFLAKLGAGGGKQSALVAKIKQAYDWLHHQGAAGFKRLPGPVQGAISTVVSVAFTGWTASQAMAEKIAEAKGATPEQAAQIRSVLAAADLTAFKPVAVATAGMGPVVAAASWVVPPVTALYIARSTALYPMATYRAAKGVIKDALKAAESKASDLLDEVGFST